MSKIILPENHHSITVADDVAKMCEPLFKHYGINYFLYARVFDNGAVYSLISNGEYQKHHFKKEYLLFPPIPSHMIGKKFYYIVTENVSGPFQPVFYDLRNLFNIWYPIFMFERYHGYFEVCIFASTPDNHDIINLYVNNLDIFEKFKSYFKEKATKLIAESEKNIIHIPEHMRSTFGGIETAPNHLDANQELFLNLINTHDHPLKNNGKTITLTERELDSIKYLKYGYTIKEIAKLMHISPRTVENHLNNIKSKFGIQRKSEIIKAILERGFTLDD